MNFQYNVAATYTGGDSIVLVDINSDGQIADCRLTLTSLCYDYSQFMQGKVGFFIVKAVLGSLDLTYYNVIKYFIRISNFLLS